MNCALCNNKLTAKFGAIDFHTQSLGRISVPNLNYLECEYCGEKLLSSTAGNKAAEYIAKQEQERINKLPIGEFITANESAEILGITKQAFSKNPKIRRGFIYASQIGDRKYYHKESVKLFKEKG